MLRVLFRRRWSFLLGASAVALATLVAATYVPPEYTATVQVESVSESPAPRLPVSQGAAAADVPVPLASRAALERAADDVGLTRWLPHDPDDQSGPIGGSVRQEIIDRLMKDLRVERVPRPGQPDAVAVSFTHRDPFLAAAIPNALAKRYLLEAERRRLADLSESRDLLQGQVASAGTRLTELTRRQVEFETKQGATLPDSPGALHKQIQEIRTNIDALRGQQVVARQKVQRLRALVKPSKPQPQEEPREVVTGPNPALKNLQDQLREAEAEVYTATSIRNMREDHPAVQTFRKKIEVLKKQIAELPPETVVQKVFGPPPAPGGSDLAVQIAAAQSEADMATMEIERLEGRLAVAESALAKFGPAREEYLGFLKQVDEQKAELKRSQDRLAEAQSALAAAEAKRGTALAAVQLAETPRVPSFPVLWQVLGVALVVGLAAGTGLALAAQVMDRTIATADDAARAFDVPVCVAIDEIVSPHRRLWRAAGRWALRPLAVLAVLTAVGLATLNVVLWLRYPEQYRQWRQDPEAFVRRHVSQWTDTFQQSL